MTDVFFLALFYALGASFALGFACCFRRLFYPPAEVYPLFIEVRSMPVLYLDLAGGWFAAWCCALLFWPVTTFWVLLFPRDEVVAVLRGGQDHE